MKVIKYKAYLKKHEEIVPVDAIDFIEKEITVIDQHGNDHYFQFDEITLIQFTGLYDKNGKEIYERDYLRNRKGNIFIVTFQDGAFGTVNRLDDKSDFVSFYDIENFKVQWEVIGNIYENPELLEVSE